MLKFERALDLLRRHPGTRYSAGDLEELIGAHHSHIHRALLWARDKMGDVKRDETARPYQYYVEK